MQLLELVISFPCEPWRLLSEVSETCRELTWAFAFDRARLLQQPALLATHPLTHLQLTYDSLFSYIHL